ncbi:MAG: flagellar basal body P-ring formation chaperone FlgA [Nitrospinota bacterium]
MISFRVLLCTLLFLSATDRAIAERRSASKYTVGRSEIERVVTGYIVKKFKTSQEKVRLGNFRYRPVILPGPAKDIRIRERSSSRKGKKILLRITFVLDTKKKKNSFLSIPFELLTSVVVSQKKLLRGTVLRAGDLASKELWMDGGDTYPKSVSYFHGKQLNQGLTAGEALTDDVVENAPVVKKGDMVTVVFEKKGIKINSKGVVRKDGAKGDTVKVFNTFSKKVVVATVINREMVRVKF